MKRIEVLVDPTGSVTIDAHGYHGSACAQATAYLETALGTVSSKTKKAAWYQARRQNIQQLGSDDAD